MTSGETLSKDEVHSGAASLPTGKKLSEVSPNTSHVDIYSPIATGFLVYFESELLRRAQKNFSFRNGSVGNYFLTAAHLFFRSVPSAIFLFSSITGSQAHILPVLVTNHTVTIAAELVRLRSLSLRCSNEYINIL